LEKLTEQGKLNNNSILAIADFSLPSTQKRLFVLDLKNYKVLFNTFVAHGKNSGREWANSFSNQPSSLKSSPGFYITHETYNGDNGYSLRLEGIEKGINDNAYEREIVMHGADYVNQSFANAKGYIGRSWGCPAVPVAEAIPIINTIKDGNCLFIYSPDQGYLSHSPVLNS
jgi:L,D-transpeptidase catalytic domain